MAGSPVRLMVFEKILRNENKIDYNLQNPHKSRPKNRYNKKTVA